MAATKSETTGPETTLKDAKPMISFEVRQRLKLWVVMKNNVYDGSFPEEAGAIEAAQKQMRAIIMGGGRAEMVASTDIPSIALRTDFSTRRKPAA